MARGARLAKREVGGRRSVRPPWAQSPTTPTKLHLSRVGWGQCPWLQGSQPRPEAEGLEVCLPGGQGVHRTARRSSPGPHAGGRPLG